MSLPRFHIEGHVYYITTVVYNRLPIFTKSAYVIPLIDSLNFYRYQHRFRLLGYCIMPDHLYLIIWLYGESTVSEIMHDYKRFISGRLARQAKVEGNQAWLDAFRAAGEETGRGEHKVWQDSFWDKIIYNERTLRQKLNYIHRNPLRAGLVECPEDYPYSSYRDYVLGNQTLIEVDTDWF
ncbi:MAG: transposase [Chloroflexota bacterium]|nr:transposase [Chloroflexota bacterium]